MMRDHDRKESQLCPIMMPNTVLVLVLDCTQLSRHTVCRWVRVDEGEYVVDIVPVPCADWVPARVVPTTTTVVVDLLSYSFPQSAGG